ncbi:MAG: type II secretion system protein [Deltaproteobacteria bacterium]
MRRRSRGFTLVELLVAAAVIAVGMVYVLGAFGRCVTALAASHNMVTATYLLEGKLFELAELYRQENGAEEGTTEGAFEEPYARFTWTRVAAGVAADIGDELSRTTVLRNNLLEETVRVAWRQGAVEREVSVTRYVLRHKP